MRDFDRALDLATALAALGATAEAIEHVEGLLDVFTPWRAARRTALFADCLADFSRVWERLDADLHERDRVEPAAVPALAAVALDAHLTLDRCEQQAARPLRANPYFADLAGRLRHSLAHLQRAFSAGDAAAVRRLMREQRTLERLMAFRFG
jgi:hypothetical protein